MTVEEPCEVTGEGCVWLTDEYEEESGDLIWDLYCGNCFRSRDWDKEEYPTNKEVAV